MVSLFGNFLMTKWLFDFVYWLLVIGVCYISFQAFIYAAVFDVANHLQIALPEHRVPQMLPVFIDDHLGSPTQEKWWSAAYRLVHGINKYVYLTILAGLGVLPESSQDLICICL